MRGAEQQIQMMGNKVLAEMGTPAADNPRTQVFPTGINRSPLLFWMGIAGGIVVLGVLLWSFFFPH